MVLRTIMTALASVYFHFSIFLSIHRMNVSLRQVDIFLAVARTMSFSQAARLCHLSQPALSANVKRLEEEVGARLFDRHTRKVSLTPLGTEFLGIATAMKDTMNLSLARLGDFVAGRRGRLVLAAAPSMAASFVPGLIAAYSAAHPDIEIELHDQLSDVCLEMVRAGSADVALSPFKPNADDLEQRELFRDPLVVICSARHPLADRASVRWRDVQAFPHVVMNRSSSVRQLVDAEYARHGMTLRPAFEVAQVGTMLGLIAAGLGIGELPESLIHNVDMTGLAHLRIGNKAAYRTICAATLRDRSHPSALPPFLELCRQHAAAWPARRDRR
jgi:LysR family transcriptional regulator, carnitine catabolism transcriptional activator